MTDARLILDVEILSFFRTATGAGQAAQQDTLCARDDDGLPHIPAKQIKGLLRDAVRRMDIWAGRAGRDAFETPLFGESGFPRKSASRDGGADQEPVPYRRARPGALTFTDAELAIAERTAFRNDAGVIAGLYTTLHSTAIDQGIARKGSLRREEVAVPILLEAEIGFEPELPDHHEFTSNWRQIITDALPLVRAVGAKRRRGLGRVRIHVRDGADAP